MNIMKTLYSCMLGVFISFFIVEASSGEILVISKKGDYAVVSNNMYEIARKGNIFNEMADRLKGVTSEIDKRRLVHKVTPHYSKKRVYLLSFLGGEGPYTGELILSLDGLRYEGFYKGFLDYFIESPDERKLYRHNRVYDSDTLKTLENYEDEIYKYPSGYKGPSFDIREYSCFVDQRHLFAATEVFDVSKDPPELVKFLLDRKGLARDCEHGIVLFVNNDEKKENALLTVYDLQNDKEITKFISKGWVGLSDDEWFITEDAKYVLRDVPETAEVGTGKLRIKTGKLRFYDLKTGKLVKELQIPIRDSRQSNILGFSQDGNIIVYGSGNSIFFIDITKQHIVSEVLLDFNPIGMAWP